MKGTKKQLRHPTAMKDEAIKEMSSPTSDSRTTRIKYAKAVETTPKSSQKHSAVSDARTMRRSKNRAASWVGLRIILVDHLETNARDNSHSVKPRVPQP
jgi:hypothetical protein